MNTNYYRKESWVDNTFSKRGKCVLTLLAVIFSVGIIAGGCGFMQNLGGANQEESPVQEVANIPAVKDEVNVPDESKVDLDVEENQASSMVSLDVSSVGRSDPFMPSDEIQAFEDAKNSALAEALAHNAQINELNKLKDVVVREADDISPYSFNLPVPPTSLASSSSAAAKITRTKVVGIMYNQANPSAILNVDDKDYLVRQGDKIIGQEYKVVQINPNWIVVSLGSNVYSASIGELFSREEFSRNQNDLYNLKNRFGGRKG
ncbi:hypothetical protein HDR58_00955 [bacterium]|nr:hypothetical protein [bacterium]